MTLGFLADNRVAGRASCNRYGKLQPDGRRVVLQSQATTMMACAPADESGKAFLELLEEVTDSRIGQHGELLLQTPAGNTIDFSVRGGKPVGRLDHVQAASFNQPGQTRIQQSGQFRSWIPGREGNVDGGLVGDPGQSWVDIRNAPAKTSS